MKEGCAITFQILSFIASIIKIKPFLRKGTWLCMQCRLLYSVFYSFDPLRKHRLSDTVTLMFEIRWHLDDFESDAIPTLESSRPPICIVLSDILSKKKHVFLSIKKT